MMRYTPYTPEAHCLAEDNRAPPTPTPGSPRSCTSFCPDTSHTILPELCDKEQAALVDSEFPVSGGVQAKAEQFVSAVFRGGVREGW